MNPNSEHAKKWFELKAQEAVEEMEQKMVGKKIKTSNEDFMQRKTPLRLQFGGEIAVSSYTPSVPSTTETSVTGDEEEGTTPSPADARIAGDDEDSTLEHGASVINVDKDNGEAEFESDKASFFNLLHY